METAERYRVMENSGDGLFANVQAFSQRPLAEPHNICDQLILTKRHPPVPDDAYRNSIEETI